MPEVAGTRDLRGYIQLLWRWKLLFLVFLIGAPVAAYLTQRGKPNIYQSTTLLGVNQETVDTTVLSNASGSFSTTNVDTIARLVTTSPVATLAAGFMRPRANPGQLLGQVSASGDPNTNLLTISAEDHSAARAAEIANAFARAISLNRRNAAIRQLDGAIAGIRAQLTRLASGAASATVAGSPQQATRAQLLQELDQFRAARATQGSQAAILQPATPSSNPVGPHLRRTVELAALIGLLLGLGAVLLAENADRRLRVPDDLEGMVDLPLLATIAPSVFAGKLDTGPADEESFQMLRTGLLHMDAHRNQHTVLITSAGEKEGKTTVAVRLALAAARAGMRTILVDADLRRGRVAPRLGIVADEGLAAVLAGRQSLEHVLIRHQLDAPNALALGVVPAGSPPANPTALIGSEAMRGVLERLRSWCDLVVIDTPAALMVSDPGTLMEHVTDVVLVARMNRTRREAVKRLKGMIETAHGNLLGVVATGSSTGVGYEYARSKYYSQNGSGRFGRGRKTAVSTNHRERGPEAVTRSSDDRRTSPAVAGDAGQYEYD